MNLEAVKSLADQLTYEELAAALYVKGEIDGFHKVTDKTKWREPVMAEKLGHKAHTKISAALMSTALMLGTKLMVSLPNTNPKQSKTSN